MIDKNTINRQHDEIKQLLAAIGGYRSLDNITENAFKISLLLGQLAGKINIHLLHEDKYVYPDLQKHQDAKVKEASLRFMREMGGLVDDFTAFKGKYMSAPAIKADPTGFMQERDLVFRAIAERIKKEDHSLYSLVG